MDERLQKIIELWECFEERDKKALYETALESLEGAWEGALHAEKLNRGYNFPDLVAMFFPNSEENFEDYY